MSFLDTWRRRDWDEVRTAILAKGPADVERALGRSGRRTLEDLQALLSPAADTYLEAMAQRSRTLTRKRFGDTLQLYVPLYLSNECVNRCLYCGFRADNDVPRRTLTPAEIDREADVLRGMGFEHILLVTGESSRTVGPDYLEAALRQLRPVFANLSLEVQPLHTTDYRRLAGAGAHAVLLYQETYNHPSYLDYHPRGPKRDFAYRLDTQDRLGEAGLHKIGLGVLYGLEDWRVDSFFVALHLDYLERRYWRSRYSISFPRLRPNVGGHPLKCPVSERDLVQVLCAFRIFNEEVELSISTRERAAFRDHLAHLGATCMSAASMTNPGGYSEGRAELEQFEIDDNRGTTEMAAMLRAQGIEPVWKDWDRAYERTDRESAQ